MHKNKRCLNVEILSIFVFIFFIKTYPVFSETSQNFFYDSNLGSIKKSNPNSPSNQLNLKQSDISNYANFIGYSYKEAKIDYNFSFFSYNSQSQSLSHSPFHSITTNNLHGYNYSAATAFLNPLFNLGFLVTLANNNNYILPAASLAFLALSFGAFVTANDVFSVIRNFESDESDYFNNNLSVHEMDLDYDPKQDESPKTFVDKIDKDSKDKFEKIINNSSEVIIMQKIDYLLSKLFNSSTTVNDNDNLKILLFRALKLSDKELKNRLLQIASLDVVTQFSDYMDYHDQISQANIDMWNQEVFYKFLTTQITTVSSLHIFLARMMKLDESLSDEYLLLKYNLGDTESAESSMFITGTINRLFDYLSSFDPVNYQLRYGPKLTRNDSYEKIKRVLLDIDPTELKTRLSYNIKKYYEINYQYLVKSKKLKLVNAESLISYLDTIDHKMRLFFLITALNLIEPVELEKLFADGKRLFNEDDFANDFIYQFIEYHSLGYIPQIKYLNKDSPAFMALVHKFEKLSDEKLLDLVKSSGLFEFISYDDLLVNSELIRQFVKTKLNDQKIKLHIFFSAFLNLGKYTQGIIAKIYRIQVNYAHQIKKDIFIDFHLFVKDYDELSIYLIEFLYFISAKKAEDLKNFIQNKKFFEHEETKKYFKARYIKNYIKFLAKSNDRLKLALFIKLLFGQRFLGSDLSSLINDHYPNHGYDDEQLIEIFSKGLKDLNENDPAFIALANKFENLSDEKLVDLVKSSKLFEFISYDDLLVNSELIRQFVKTKLNDDQIKLHIFFSAFLNLGEYSLHNFAQIYNIHLKYITTTKKDIFIDFHLFIKDHDELSRYIIEFLYFISTKYKKDFIGFIQNKDFFAYEASKKYFKAGYIKNYIKFLAKSNDQLKLALFIKLLFGQRFLGSDLSSLINNHYPNHGYDDKDHSQLIDLFLDDFVQNSYKSNQQRAYKRHNKQDINKESQSYDIKDIKQLENLFKNLSEKDLLKKVRQSSFTKNFDNLAKINSKLIHNYLDSIKSKPIKYYLFLSEIFQRDIPLTIVIKHLNIAQKNIANARFNMKKNFQDYININSLSPADFNDRFYKLSDDELIFLFNKNIMKNTEASNNLTDIKDFYESIAKSDVKAYLFLHLLFNGTISKKDYGYIGKKYSHYSNYLKKIVDNLISDYQTFLNNIDI